MFLKFVISGREDHFDYLPQAPNIPPTPLFAAARVQAQLQHPLTLFRNFCSISLHLSFASSVISFKLHACYNEIHYEEDPWSSYASSGSVGFFHIAGSLLKNTIDQGTGFVAGSWSNHSHALAILVCCLPSDCSISFRLFTFYRTRHSPTIRTWNYKEKAMYCVRIRDSSDLDKLWSLRHEI
jgi:hypothetical protein